MDGDKIRKGIRLILEGIGEDLNRPGLQKTPERSARMCEEIFAGVQQQAFLESTFTEHHSDGEVIALEDLPFYSVCEHHLLPFFGTATIRYCPQNQKIAGFSGIARLVDTLSARPQIQERLTNQLADMLWEALAPRWVEVRLEARHLCASMRGAHKKEMRIVTAARRGLDDAESTHDVKG